jgi:hypothetical protein
MCMYLVLGVLVLLLIGGENYRREYWRLVAAEQSRHQRQLRGAWELAIWNGLTPQDTAAIFSKMDPR